MIYVKRSLAHAAGTAAATVTGWIPLDPSQHPFEVSFMVVPATTGGSFAFTVQHTLENPLDPSSDASAASTAAAPTAMDHSTVSGKTAKIDGNYAFPIAAIRLVSHSASSTDPNYTFYVRQGGL